MIRQYITILVLTTAQLLFLGHSIIPHQHEEHPSHHHESQENHNHDDSHSENEDFVHFFFDFSHAENSNDFLRNFTRLTFEKSPPLFYCSIQDSAFKVFPELFLRQNSPPENLLFNSFYILPPPSLRGPPKNIA